MKCFLSRSLVVFLVVVSPFAIAAPETVGAVDPVWRYTVKPGDNLITIAGRYFSRADQWPKVQKANRIADPHRILPGTVLRIPAGMLRKEPGAARLERVHGAVRWRDGDGEWQAAGNGLRLAAGTSVETQEDSSALLILADDSRVVLSPGSLLALDSLSLYAGGLMADTRLRLQRGQTDIMANPGQRPQQNLRIQTPVAQAVVRGTQFRVGVGESLMREETLSGLVEVRAAGKSVSIPPERGTVTKAGEPPMPPVPLLPAANVSDLPARFEHLPMRFELPQLPGASEWQGQVAPDQEFQTILLGKSVRTGPLVFADLANGNYVLRLRAIDANGLFGRDALHSFTVFARPFPPGLNVPGDSATIRTARPGFVWGNVLEAERYRVQVATDAGFSTVLHDQVMAGESGSFGEDLPAGPLYWRAASITDAGEQGPWSRPASFVYKPGPGPADLGKAALQIDGDTLILTLPQPPAGMRYEAVLADNKEMQPVLTRAAAVGETLQLVTPGAGSYYLGVRLVDASDETPGPVSVQKVDLPAARAWWLLTLLPLLL